MASFESIAAYTGFGLGLLNASVGVVNLVRNRREGVRTRQRDLRGELRDILREISDACDEFEDGETHYLNNTFTRSMADKLQRVRDEGLLSPSDTQLEQLQDLLLDIGGRHLIPQQLPQSALSPQQFQQLTQANLDRLNLDEARLHKRVRTFMRATSRIDNGSYLAYWRFKHFGLWRSQGA